MHRPTIAGSRFNLLVFGLHVCSRPPQVPAIASSANFGAAHEKELLLSALSFASTMAIYAGAWRLTAIGSRGWTRAMAVTAVTRAMAGTAV